MGIGEWLRSQGHDVHYLVGETKRRQLSNIHSLSRNVTVRFNGNRTTIPLPTSRKKLKQLLDKEQFDVLHVQIPHSPFMAHRLILAASPRTAIIGTFHIAAYNHMVWVGNWLLYLLLWRSIRRFDQVLSVSEAAQEFARSTFHVKAEISPNVIDYNLFHRAKPLPQYSGNNTLNVLFLGRLVPRKGCEVLLKAVARIKKELGTPDFRVIICGKGPQAEALQQLVSRSGLDNMVEMTGFISETDKPRYYASADISVFPSSGGESFGIVLLEAMASGQAAVLAGDNPGYHSVMAQKPALLFDPTDVDALADKLKHYLIDRSLRKDAQQWGASYTKQFDQAVVGNQLLGIYAEALRKRRQA
jgi:phosphatidylinositol alpha-mannosyltransferase